MDIQKVIKDLERKIKQLEQKVADLHEEVASIKRHPKSTIDRIGKLKKNMSRTESREYTLKQLEHYNPEFFAMKAKREEGSGIVLKNKYKNSFKYMKFYHSLSQSEERLSGAFKISQKALHEEVRYSHFIFNILWRGKMYSFIFPMNDLDALLDTKEHDKQNNYHLNFEMRGNDFFEVRGKRPHSPGINITENYEAWTVEE